MECAKQLSKHQVIQNVAASRIFEHHNNIKNQYKKASEAKSEQEYQSAVNKLTILVKITWGIYQESEFTQNCADEKQKENSKMQFVKVMKEVYSSIPTDLPDNPQEILKKLKQMYVEFFKTGEIPQMDLIFKSSKELEEQSVQKVAFALASGMFREDQRTDFFMSQPHSLPQEFQNSPNQLERDREMKKRIQNFKDPRDLR